jgi:alkanesulfonate monooxygenase SsuD/methylene tetrahydromethanopterin reductase-like flavin-dependent oxidoreductase (luciferase family)
VVLKKLWTEPLVEFEGEFHSLHAVGINPLPVQRPIPLWFGGSADPVLRRMAKHGAGWMITGKTPEQSAPLVETLHGYLADEGRDPANFGIDVRISVAREPRETWDGTIQAWRDLGVTHVGVVTMGAGFTSVDGHIAALREFKATVG